MLGDPDKRAHFDRYGVDTADSASGGNTSTSQFRGFNGQEFHGQVSPEELFRMFMGDEFPGFGNVTCFDFSIPNWTWSANKVCSPTFWQPASH